MLLFLAHSTDFWLGLENPGLAVCLDSSQCASSSSSFEWSDGTAADGAFSYASPFGVHYNQGTFCARAAVR